MEAKNELANIADGAKFHLKFKRTTVYLIPRTITANESTIKTIANYYWDENSDDDISEIIYNPPYLGMYVNINFNKVEQLAKLGVASYHTALPISEWHYSEEDNNKKEINGYIPNLNTPVITIMEQNNRFRVNIAIPKNEKEYYLVTFTEKIQ